MFSTGFDARFYSGVTFATKSAGADKLTFPVFSSSEGQYPDVISLLTGFNTVTSLQDEFNAAWAAIGGDGAIIVAFDEDGYLTISKGGGVDGLIIENKPDNAYWGIEQADITILPGQTYTCPSKPQNRRNLFSEDVLTSGPNQLSIFRVLGGGVEGFVPRYIRLTHNIPITLRNYGGDNLPNAEWIDDANLMYIDAEASGGESEGRVEWGVTCYGKVYRMASVGILDGSSTFTWTEAGKPFARELGFSGKESMQVIQSTRIAGIAGQFYYLEADNVCPHLLAPSKGLASHDLMMSRRNPSERLISGQYSSFHIGDYPAYELEFMLNGPARVIDETAHYLYQWIPNTPIGESVYFYQNFPETRFAKLTSKLGFNERDVTNDYVSSQSGDIGVWRTYYSEKNPSDIKLDFNMSSRVRLLDRINLTLDLELDQFNG